MKKEIEQLLASENATLKINRYCRLHRWQRIDFPVQKVDGLRADFSVVHAYDYAVDIKARTWQGVVEEVAQAQVEAFRRAGDEYAKRLKNGYLG